MYSVVTSIIINYIIGKALYFRFLLLLIYLQPIFWLKRSRESIIYLVAYVAVMLILCIEYNYKRYRKKVKEHLCSKIFFWISTLLSLFAYAGLGLLKVYLK